jgi:hypothetical protein
MTRWELEDFVISELSIEVMRYKPRRFINLTVAALKRKNDRDLFLRWVVEGHSTRLSFEDFKKQLIPIRKESKEDILERTKDMMEKAQWQHHSLSL